MKVARPPSSMEGTRLAPTAGVAASLAVLAALAAALPLVDGSSALLAYYAGGSVNGLGAGLFALVAIIVFAAGREGRSDPATAAGVALVLGAFAAVLAVLWAATVPSSLVLQLGTATILEFHRWLVALVSLGLPASAAWYARELGLL